MIELAAIEDNRLLIDGLHAWASSLPDIHLAAVTATVDELLQVVSGQHDVVLLNPLLRADPDPAVNVRRLIDAGHRVLVIDGSADLSMVARSLGLLSPVRGTRARDRGPDPPRTFSRLIPWAFLSGHQAHDHRRQCSPGRDRALPLQAGEAGP